MKKVSVNSKAVIQDLAWRVRRNEEGVRAFLSRAGVDCAGDKVQLADLQHLLKVNPDAFDEMVQFLYGGMANADTAASTTTTKGSTFNTEAANFSGALISSIVGTAGSTLASIFGKTDQTNVIALQQQQAERQQRMIYVILAVVAVIGVVIAVVAMRNGNASQTIVK